MKNIPVEDVCSIRLPHDVQRKRLERVIREELSPVQREVLISYYLQDKTIPQIAAERGVNRSSVCRALQRAKYRLRRFLRY